MKKKRLTHGQAMVEYALLLAMVAVSMTVILATVGNSAGTVWLAIVDNFETNPMFGLPTSSVSTTSVTTAETSTATASITPDGPTLTPSETLHFTLTPSETYTNEPTHTPTETSTPAIEPTAVSSATPVMLAITSAKVVRKIRAIVVTINVNRTVDLTVKDTFSTVEKSATCIGTCIIKFDPLPSMGFIEIKSEFGDDINLSYPAAP